MDALKLWVPSIISIVTLLINLLFYAFGQPLVSFKLKRKENLVTISEEFMVFLSEVVSKTDFDGVPTQIRNYSLKIHLYFKTGEAPEPLKGQLEKIFQLSKSRKSMTGAQVIEQWNNEFRDEVRKLRVNLAEYTGIF